MPFQQQSLRRRLLIAAALLLIVFMGLMGAGLNNAFKQSVLSNAEDALRNQILLLISSVEVNNNSLTVANNLSEARLSQPDSDLFAQISTPDEGVIWRSPSLYGADMPELLSELGEFRFYSEFAWPQQPPMFATALDVAWETDQGDLPFTIQVAEKSTAYDNRLQAYRQQIILWLAVLGSSLLALLLLLLTWALRPLVRVTHQVAEIEQGQRQRFDEDYPSEVSRLTQNLNQLLNVEEQRIRHQKEVLGNLAHSLKTPVAVLKGIEYADSYKQEVDTQLSSIQNIIDYQLQSASTVGRRRFAKPIEIEESTHKILSSLRKLYATKDLKINLDIQTGTLFYGDQGDWMELCGNLLENAFKWANSEISVKIQNQPNKAQPDTRKLTLLLTVADDGRGIDEKLKSTILQRGVRLDSQTPGHGLGLNIVKGIVDAYEGKLSITNNQPNGAVFRVLLT